VALATANSQFNDFQIRPKRIRWVSKAALAVLLIISSTILSLTRGHSEVLATNPNTTQHLTNNTTATLDYSWTLEVDVDTQDTQTQISLLAADSPGRYAYEPGASGKVIETVCADNGHTGKGWILDTPFEAGGKIATGAWEFTFYEDDTYPGNTQPNGTLEVCAYKVIVSGGLIQSSTKIFDTANPNMTAWSSTDIIEGNIDNTTYTTDSVSEVSFSADEYLYIQYSLNQIVQNKNVTSVFSTGETGALDPKIVFPTITIPENVVFFIAAAPFIPMVVMWMKKRRGAIINA